MNRYSSTSMILTNKKKRNLQRTILLLNQLVPSSQRQRSSSSLIVVAAGGSSRSTNDNNMNVGTTTNLNDSFRLNIHEKAKTVTSMCTSGTLCTIMSNEQVNGEIQGAPFGSFVDYVLDDDGNPVLLMNEMSMHTINIQKAQQEQEQQQEQSKNDSSSTSSSSPLVTLFTQLSGGGGGGGGGNHNHRGGGFTGSSAGVHNNNNNSKKGLQDSSRCSLTGTLVKMDPSTALDMDMIRMRYSLTHTYADQVMDSSKFAFYRLVPKHIYYVGGFGVLAEWINVEQYRIAEPDILSRDAVQICDNINRNYYDDLISTAKHLLDVTTDIERITMTSIDRLGFDIRVTSTMKTRRNKLQTDEFRIGFRIPVLSVEDAKSEIIKVFQEAWEKGNGISWKTTTGVGGGGGSFVNGESKNNPANNMITTTTMIEEEEVEEEEEIPGADVPIMKIAADSLE